VLTLISIACNNPDNGHFTGHFSALHYGNDQDTELQHADFLRGPRVTYLGDGRVRLSRRIFEYEREKEWYGNWCWNALWMRPEEARRLLRYLRESGGWHCEGGPVRLYDWFNRLQKPQCSSSESVK
jgi:hypothetical protein